MDTEHLGGRDTVPKMAFCCGFQFALFLKCVILVSSLIVSFSFLHYLFPLVLTILKSVLVS